jgi:hypothetical protein
MGFRSVTCARHGYGPRVKPGIGFSVGIKLESEQLLGMEKRKRCMIDVKNKNIVLLAKDSPRQIRFPDENINVFK